MKILVTHRFEDRHYLVRDREVNQLNQLISFYHSSWSNMPAFEKLMVEDLDTHQNIEVEVKDLVFEKEELG